MTIYHVPLIGFIVAAKEITKAQAAYFACNAKGGSCWDEFHATSQPFENCSIAFASTIIGCVVLMAVVSLVTNVCKRRH